jgi:enoyl-[acyl-carrier protein] reductase I
MLKGKNFVIFGASNNRSIAWSITELLHKNEANIILVSHPVMRKRVEELGELVNAKQIIDCDVLNDESIAKAITEITDKFEKIDGILHSIAFSNKDNLAGKSYNLTRSDFNLAMEASVFSFMDIIKRLANNLADNASILTLTYYGAEKVIPNYNIMGVAKAALEASVKYLANDLGEKGIRVNAISAGPLRTLAASGIKDFVSMLDFNAKNNPLKRNVTLEDVAKTALYLFSDLSSGVTAETIYVDCGYSVIGMPNIL